MRWYFNNKSTLNQHLKQWKLTDGSCRLSGIGVMQNRTGKRKGHRWPDDMATYVTTLRLTGGT